MRKQVLAFVAFGLLVLGFGASQAWAQHQVEANFKFDFMVDGNKMPAGGYVVTADGDRVLIKSTVAGGTETKVTVVTRIASRELPKVKFFFDKDGEGVYYLAELQIPGEDGWVFKGSGRPHTHVAAEATDK
jgi:hypothetical protein